MNPVLCTISKVEFLIIFLSFVFNTFYLHCMNMCLHYYDFALANDTHIILNIVYLKDMKSTLINTVVLICKQMIYTNARVKR